MNTEKKRSFIINFIYCIILAAIAVLLLKYALPMLTPFVLGFAIAYIMKRPTKYVVRKLKIRYKIAAFFMVLLFYATVGVLVVLLVVKAISSLQTLISAIPYFYETDIAPMLSQAFDGLENTVLEVEPSLFGFISGIEDQLLQSLGKMISSVSVWAVTTASSLATAIPGLVIKLILMIISSFFIAMDYDILLGFCKRQLNEGVVTFLNQVREYIIGTLFVYIRSYAIIMSITFVELSIGLNIAGLEHPILIAALISIFDILPVLGTGGIMLPWVVISLLCGDYSLALTLLVIYLVITVIRNIIEPKIVGKQLGLHPIVTLVSMSVGLQLFGVIGLFGFPIILSLLRNLNDNGTIQIFK